MELSDRIAVMYDGRIVEHKGCDREKSYYDGGGSIQMQYKEDMKWNLG